MPIRLRKFLSKKKEEKKCKHEWVVTETHPTLKCEICNTVLTQEISLVCKYCKKKTYRRESVRGFIGKTYEEVIQPPSTTPSLTYSFYLCEKCQKEFEDTVRAIKEMIEQSAKTISGLQVLSETRTLSFTNLLSLKYFLHHFVRIISDVKESYVPLYRYNLQYNIYGLVFYAIPENPLAPPYRIIFPYRAVLNHIKTRKEG